MAEERTPNILAIVPSRGGSQGLKRKNLLPVDGTPMFLRTAQAARDAGCEVIVSTDDAEIRSTAVVAGFRVHDRGPELADVVVDEVVKAAAKDWDGPVLLVQPTVQPITAAILSEMLDASQAWATPRSMVEDQTHQIWHNDEWLLDRVNRQERTNCAAREVGVRWWPTVDTVGEETYPWSTTRVYDLIDVDTAADYRSIIVPKTIALWPVADKLHGMGHLRRCLAIAERLQHHRIVFLTDDMDPDAIRIVEDRGWFVTWTDAVGSPDLWILDRLDNNDIPHLDGNVVTLEDTSNYQADVSIDALYADGADWCVLRPEFYAGDYTVTDKTHSLKLMLLFGGTDPSNLGERVHRLFPNHRVEWVQAGDDKPIAELMHRADLLITSAGRTVFEAAAVGVPTVVLAQNLRETTHTHLGYEHGNVYLGLGRLVSDQTIRDTVLTLEGDVGLRRELSERGRPDGKGLDRIVHEVEGLLAGL